MTVLFISGFDWTASSADLSRKFDTVYSAGLTASDSRYGGYSLSLSGGLGAYVHKLLPTGSNYDTVCAGFAYRTLGLTNSMIFTLQDGSGYQITLYLQSDGYLRIYRGDYNGTLLDTTSTYPLSANVWAFIEIKVYIHDSAGTVQLKVNGNTVSNLTSQDTRQYGAYITYVSYRNQGTQQFRFCDLWITDGEFLGDCRIKTYFPDSDETYQMFQRSAGSDNYALVDDTDPDDDTTYVESATLNAKDSFGITPSLPGVVKAIQLSTMAKKTGTAQVKMKNLIRSGGSDYNSTDEKTLSTGYSNLMSIHETDPDDSNPWTQAKVSGAEFGYQITAITTTTTTTVTSTTTTAPP